MIRIGTRTSQLALWQSKHVAALLEAAWSHVRCELVPLVTQGDRRLDRPLPEIGGKGLFTAELEDALRNGVIDVAVHSLKDLPVEDSPGLTVGAIPSRVDVRDVLIAGPAWSLATLPQQARVGTSSLRRQAQLAAYRPDLRVEPIRGNVDTRLRKVLAGEYHAVVMAAAGLARLGLEAHIREWLDLALMLPAPGQGALGVQCRSDADLLNLLAPLDDARTRAAVTAERRLLQELGGGCSVPIAALATLDGAARITLIARVVSLDGRAMLTVTTAGEDPQRLAEDAAAMLLQQGAATILRDARQATQAKGVSLPGEGDVQPSVPVVLPLVGRRVLVTRAVEQAMPLAKLLEEAGAQVMLLPTVRIVPLSPAVEGQGDDMLDGVDVLIFTSANAVRTFVEGYPGAVRRITAGTVTPLVVAIGPATEAVLRAAGMEAAFVPDEYTATALPARLGDLTGKRVLLPRSALGDAVLPDALRSLGAQVTELRLYTTVATEPDRASVDRLLAAGRPDYVTYTSPSTVNGLRTWMAADARLADLLAMAQPVCIGPTTAQALEGTAKTAPIVAQTHTVEGMVAAMIADCIERGVGEPAAEP